jgi:glycosyltransferase involved in cell wall biosynthesis
MKLIIQIPCFNEEKTLPETIRDIPKKIEGIDKIEILIIDDGSTDRTVEVAKQLKADHVLQFTHHKGLAFGFKAGVDKALELGADIIVNTDADNQYRGEYIASLIDPILKQKADVVIGARQFKDIKHFSWYKKLFQKLGAYIVGKLSWVKIPDVTSGFRALSREAAIKLNILTSFTYTLDMILQSGHKQLLVTTVPIEVNPPTRPSRLFKSIKSYISQSLVSIGRIVLMYRPLKTFLYLGFLVFGMGLIVGIRFVYYYLKSQGQGHVQSLILCAIFLLLGVQISLFGFIGDIISFNRKIMEEILLMQRKQVFNGKR